MAKKLGVIFGAIGTILGAIAGVALGFSTADDIEKIKEHMDSGSDDK